MRTHATTTRGLTAPGSPRTRRGLSLIEVMLALTIMLLALVAIGRLVDIGTDRGTEARMNVRGNRLAQWKMAEVEAGSIPVSTGGSGQFDGDDKDWSWSVDSQPQGPPNLYLVTVTVSRSLRGTPFTVTLAQMMIDPAAQGTAAQAEQPPDTSTDGSAAGGTTGGTTK